MNLETRSYREQEPQWPRSGRHILAHHDEETVVVYQAYRPAIADYAERHGHFGGEYSFSRMSWIKPNFLWMMFRCGWATKENQERVLGLRIRRRFLDELLASAVQSSFIEEVHGSHADWQRAVESSEVRLQWDPDHDPTGHEVERRALQLGLRGETLHAFGKREILEVIPMTDFVASQRGHALPDQQHLLTMPIEQVYIPAREDAARCVGLDGWEPIP